MSIRVMCAESEPGAYCDLHWSREQMAKGHRPIVMREFAVGRVLRTGERNGYHDSDFYALYWDDETASVKMVEYASTRGWTYPNSADIDATPEVIALAEAWDAALRAQREAAAAAERARKLAETADACDLTLEQLERLVRAAAGRLDLSHERARIVIALLSTLKAQRFRSEFRKSLAEHVRAWALNDAPGYDSPLSFKQWAALEGRAPRRSA